MRPARPVSLVRCAMIRGMESFPWLESGKLPPNVANKISRLTESGCWEWGAAKTGGYGVVQWNGRIRRAHRVVYELLRGPISDGLETDHLCRNRACVNPDHIEPVPQKVNNARSESASAKHARQTHCKRGHPFSSDNTYIAKRERGKQERFCRECCRERDRQRYAQRKEVSEP